MPDWCVRCRDWGRCERHEDHWPPKPTPDPAAATDTDAKETSDANNPA